jgi:hypothetical protein
MPSIKEKRPDMHHLQDYYTQTQITMRETYLLLGFEVLRGMAVKSSIFCHITPRNSVKVNRRSGGTHHLQLQGRKASQAETNTTKVHEGTGQHGIISQKAEIFTFTRVFKTTWLFFCTRTDEFQT